MALPITTDVFQWCGGEAAAAAAAAPAWNSMQQLRNIVPTMSSFMERLY